MDDSTVATEAQEVNNGQEVETVGVASATASVIRDVGGLESPEALDGVTSMINVGVVIVPEPLLTKLSRSTMRNAGVTIPVPAGAKLRQFSGRGRCWRSASWGWCCRRCAGS